MEADLNKNLQDEKWKPLFQLKDRNPEQTDKVISAYEELYKTYPKTEVAGESLYRIGMLYLYRKNKPGIASDFFKRTADDYHLSSFSYAASGELANISLINGNLEEAADIYQQILSSSRVPHEEKNSARFNLAKIMFYKGDFSEAKSLLEEIIRNLKDNSANDAIELSLLINTSMSDSSNLLLFAEGEKLASMKDFRSAAEKFGRLAGNQNSFMLQGIAKLKQAEMELALDNIEKSVELLETIADEKSMNIYSDKALYLLGKIYQYGIKDILKAVEAYERLLAEFPSSLYLDEAREEIIKLRDKQS
jgi:outer membrane protein assembly factor BamD (BamD/ComL family)